MDPWGALAVIITIVTGIVIVLCIQLAVCHVPTPPSVVRAGVSELKVPRVVTAYSYINFGLYNAAR